MDSTYQQRLQLLFATSVAAGGLFGVTPLAHATLPTSNTFPAGFPSFSVSGNSAYLSLHNDSIYRWASANQQGVYVDYRASNPTFNPVTTTLRACRRSWTGNAQVCGADSKITDNAPWPRHRVALNTSGLNGHTNSAWDYYFAHVSTPVFSNLQVYGGAAVLGW